LPPQRAARGVGEDLEVTQAGRRPARWLDGERRDDAVEVVQPLAEDLGPAVLDVRGERGRAFAAARRPRPKP
jgi:hypothetical protein